MIEFGKRSKEHIATLDAKLQLILYEYARTAPKRLDISITCGHRGMEEQTRAVREGRSKTPWPRSKHNSSPSKAFDFAPYPLREKGWEDLARFARVVGFLEACAARCGVGIRCGLDWDRDGQTIDERFIDYPHVELWEIEA